MSLNCANSRSGASPPSSRGQSFQSIEVYTFAMLVYFVILFPVTRGIDMFYQRVAHLGRS